MQALANGGVLVIDDFGRQRVAPRDLLNRWIVPLESRVDYLTLQTGQKFELPFAVMLVFATNMRRPGWSTRRFSAASTTRCSARARRSRGVPRDLPGPTAETRTCPSIAGSSTNCSMEYYRPRNLALRGCHPRDLIEQALSLAEYLGEPPRTDARAARGRVRQLLRRRYEEPAPRCIHDRCGPGAMETPASALRGAAAALQVLSPAWLQAVRAPAD